MKRILIALLLGVSLVSCSAKREVNSITNNEFSDQSFFIDENNFNKKEVMELIKKDIEKVDNMYNGYELGCPDLADEIAVKNLLEIIEKPELRKRIGIDDEELLFICKAVKKQLLDNANRIIQDDRLEEIKLEKRID